MTLSSDQLNDIDQMVLDLLEEGRLTPALAQKQLVDRNIADISRQYVNQRLKRLEEHAHVQNLHDTGVYELVEDPRD